MKKAHFLPLALACVMALSGCSVPKKPFRELTGAEIRSASVRLSPPDLTVLIQDTDRLAELLQDVTLYEAAPSYTEYAGQAAAFTLELGDGTQTTPLRCTAGNLLLAVAVLRRFVGGHRIGQRPPAGLPEAPPAPGDRGGDRRAPVPGRARLHRGRPLLERRPLV